jgi:hypothetical protein
MQGMVGTVWRSGQLAGQPPGDRELDRASASFSE